MRLAAFTIFAGLALSASAAPIQDTSAQQHSNSQEVVIAYEVPGTQNRGLDPISPEGPLNPTWDDTADTSDELDDALNAEADSDADVHLEAPLNNETHAPLLEEVEPVDVLPLEKDTAPEIKDPIQPEDPFSNPLP